MKFNPGHPHLTHQEFISLKKNVMSVAAANKCIFLVSMVLHNLAKSPDEARRNAINTICYHYDCYLIGRKVMAWYWSIGLKIEKSTLI
jgi:hypothetical protein